jgi:hypothetical protein
LEENTERKCKHYWYLRVHIATLLFAKRGFQSQLRKEHDFKKKFQDRIKVFHSLSLGFLNVDLSVHRIYLKEQRNTTYPPFLHQHLALVTQKVGQRIMTIK